MPSFVGTGRFVFFVASVKPARDGMGAANIVIRRKIRILKPKKCFSRVLGAFSRVKRVYANK